MATDTETGDGSGCDNETALLVRMKDIKGIKVGAQLVAAKAGRINRGAI
jgi:hypothetical protein